MLDKQATVIMRVWDKTPTLLGEQKISLKSMMNSVM